MRFANARDLSVYDLGAYDAGAAGEVTRVGAGAAFEEAIFLCLRLMEGVSVAALSEEFGRERVAACEEAAAELIEGGLLDMRDGRWKLTLSGRLVSNEVFTHLLMGVPA